MRIHVAAYAASAGLDNAGEAALYDGLAALGIAGLEIPFTGSPLAPSALIRSDWSVVVTTLPGTIERLRDDVHFGLASMNRGGRDRAVAFAESARLAVHAMNTALGRRAVRAVMLHSAPRLGGSGAKSSVESFADALSELRARDWQGATLLVEHCDAALPDRKPDKGFLRVEDDALALKLSYGAVPAALAINWGRSAVETRSADGARDHIARAVQADLLGALFFSGATAEHDEYGPWRDWHAPLSTSWPGSLLTPEAAKAALAAAGSPPLLGLKIQTWPKSLSVPERLDMIRDGLEALT